MTSTEGDHPAGDRDWVFDTEGAFDTTGGGRTVPSKHRARSAAAQLAPDSDDTIVVDRAARAPHGVAPDDPVDDDTIRVRTPLPRVDEAAADAAPAAAPAGRTAYSPTPDILRASYAARPVAPVIAERSATPSHMAQSAVDGEALDRSLRGKARRRMVGLATAITIAVVGAGCLLAALILSLVG